jgi:hypothetical protein
MVPAKVAFLVEGREVYWVLGEFLRDLASRGLGRVAITAYSVPNPEPLLATVMSDPLASSPQASRQNT